MFKEKKMIKATIIIGLLILLVPAFVMAQTTPTIRVNCDRGRSVQSLLDRLLVPATIVVTGTCHENIVIKEDDVTLKGGTYLPLDPLQNTILVQGARRVVITGVTVTGGRSGIAAYQGGSLTIDGNSNISGATQSGVVSVYGSSVTVNSSTIQGNLYGVTATDNSALVLTNSTITGNTSTGVLVIRSSSARIGQNILGVVGANTITNNGGSGVSISRSSNALVDGNTIDNNTGIGVSIEGASATVTNNSIKSNASRGILVYSSGNARIGITDSSGYGKNFIENNAREGIQIESGSNAFVLKNDIKNNGLGFNSPGIGIYRGTCHMIGDNLIQNNKNHGIAISEGSLFQGIGTWVIDPPPGQDKIQGNTLSGILAFLNSAVDLRSIEINGNSENGIYVNQNSALRIYGSTVSNNGLDGIRIDADSVVNFYYPPSDSPASVTGNTGMGLNCFGNKSSYGPLNFSGIHGNLGGDINPSCTGF